MAKTMGARTQERDWSVLKGVVAGLWVTAVLVLLTVHYAVPRDQDIVIIKMTPQGKVSPVHLAGTAAQ